MRRIILVYGMIHGKNSIPSCHLYAIIELWSEIPLVGYESNGFFTYPEMKAWTSSCEDRNDLEQYTTCENDLSLNGSKKGCIDLFNQDSVYCSVLPGTGDDLGAPDLCPDDCPFCKEISSDIVWVCCICLYFFD